MNEAAFNILSIVSGICSIIALLLFFITLPRQQRTVSLLITCVSIGLPVVFLLINESSWVATGAVIVYVISVGLFAYRYGKTKAEAKGMLPDIVSITNNRRSGQDWMVERIAADESGIIEIDCYGVKINALYSIIKGATFKSKLPHDVVVTMRVLLLEPESAGVRCRAKLESKEKVLKDVTLMNEIYCGLVKEYRRHPNHSLKVRTFDFAPPFYILRVNKEMLIGTYLAESGYENLSFHLRRHDGKTFDQFDRFFNQVWKHCSKPVAKLVQTTK
jgi:Ca2+/Na+ antiporter